MDKDKNKVTNKEEVTEVNDVEDTEVENLKTKKDALNKEEVKENKVINKKVIIAVTSAASLVLIVSIIFGASIFKENKIIKQADSLISIEKYEDAIALYENLLSKKYIPALVTKRDSAMELMESNENFEKGIEAFDDDDKRNAIKYFSRIPESDKKKYEEATEKLSDLEEVTIMEIEDLIESGNLDEANKIVNEHLKLSPDSIDMKNAKETIASKYTEDENEAKAEEQAQKNQEIAQADAANNEAANRKKKEDAQSIANHLMGSYKTIISEEANLRDAPTLKSNVYYTVPRGTEVYISDTQIESSDRIWCQVSTDYGTGWISYNTMNYKIQ